MRRWSDTRQQERERERERNQTETQPEVEETSFIPWWPPPPCLNPFLHTQTHTHARTHARTRARTHTHTHTHYNVQLPLLKQTFYPQTSQSQQIPLFGESAWSKMCFGGFSGSSCLIKLVKLTLFTCFKHGPALSVLFQSDISQNFTKI